MIRAEGGKVAGAVSAKVDYLVVGQTRTSGLSAAKKKAAALNKKGAAIQVLDEAALHALLTPTREEALAMLTGGKSGVARWRKLYGPGRFPAAVDLGGADLRGADLRGADLRGAF